MAVVQNPFLSTAARGSLFGLTASFGRGGATMKKKAKPSTKYEPTQNRVRAILGYLSRQWGELTDEQRDSWGKWAIDHPGTDKFGDPFVMSGFNAFIMLNHHAVRFGTGDDMQELPPEEPPPASDDALDAKTGTEAEGDITLQWTQIGTGVVDDYNEIQIAGPFQSMGRKSVKARFAFLTKTTGEFTMLTLSGLDVGMWYWIRIRYVDQYGQVTAWAVDQATPYAGA
ncbi:hypothetical protein ES703_21465 [subsurface metagenome]